MKNTRTEPNPIETSITRLFERLKAKITPLFELMDDLTLQTKDLLQGQKRTTVKKRRL